MEENEIEFNGVIYTIIIDKNGFVWYKDPNIDGNIQHGGDVKAKELNQAKEIVFQMLQHRGF